ncbi:lipase 3 precursor, partial [Aureobasidium melanogenum]
MRSSLLLTLLFCTTVLAVPLEERTTAPVVQIQNGTIVGSSSSGVDNFLGIPYAEPPTGTNRLKPPQTITSAFGTITATSNPPACPQLPMAVNTTNIFSNLFGGLLTPVLTAERDQSEDCLFINVQRPAGISSDAKLPVIFWIFGGGFEIGANGGYDGANFVTKSVALDAPVIWVSVNYRVGGFGFLAGKQLATEGSTNLGLRDQRLGLEWVSENIAAFGGDPTKVTLWGESAGSISVCDQTVINGGDNTYKGQPLFRGGIMDSGSILPAEPVTAPKAQAVFDAVAKNAGCNSTADVLDCLRALPYEQYLAAANSMPGFLSYSSNNLAYLPRPDPSNNFYNVSPEISFSKGAYAKVPIIIGDQEDEGTIFALPQANISTNAQLIEYIASWFLPGNPNATEAVAGFVANYPDQPELGQPAGSPFGTGSSNNFYPQFKRLAAILGDLEFTLARRNYLSIVSSDVNAWSYLNTYLYGSSILGTFHISDLLVAFGDGTLESGLDSQTVQQYYISFVNHQNPNALGTAAPLIDWPQYSTEKPTLLNFATNGLSYLPDNFRAAAGQYLATHGASFHL